MRFEVTTPYPRLAEDVYLRTTPVPHRPGAAPPPMPAGADVRFHDTRITVLWAEADEALIQIEGERWLMSHLRPNETPFRPSYEAGLGIREWIIRERR